MTHTQTTSRNCFALSAGKKRTRPAGVGALVPVFEKSSSELKLKQKPLKYKSTIQIAIFNVRTLNRIGQLPEPTVSAINHKIDIICIQEHRYIYSEDINITIPAMDGRLSRQLHGKNSVNAAIVGVGILIGQRAQKSFNSIEKIQERMMVATFNGNASATVISCYSPINISEKMDLIAQINKNVNNKFS